MFPSTESNALVQSPLTKLKASFVSPGLAGKAHFASSMSGFGMIVKKKPKTSTIHSPEEKEAKIIADDEKDNKTEINEEGDDVSTSASSSNTTIETPSSEDNSASKSSPESRKLSDLPDDLPNPFKRTCVTLNTTDSFDDEENGDDEYAKGDSSTNLDRKSVV